LTYGVRTQQRAGEWTNELAFLEAHRARSPDDPLNLAALAVRYYAQGELNLAGELLDRARQNEDRFNAYYSEIGRINIALNLATIHLSRRDLESARLKIERGLDLDPDEPAVRQMEGTYYLAADDPAEAVRSFLRLTELEPTSLAGWNGLIESYSGLGQEAEASSARARLIELTSGADGGVANSSDRGPPMSDRARFTGIFTVALAVMIAMVATLLWTWSQLRKRWLEWQNELSSS
jgi:predicted Zn-dependent protease